MPPQETQPPLSDPPQAKPDQYDRRVLQALRHIIRAFDLHSRQLEAQHQLTAPQLLCLLAVQEREPISVSAIAIQVHLSSSTVIGILDRLQAKGLVRRERDVHDRRLVRVSLTEQGRGLARNAPSPLQTKLLEGIRALPDAEAAALAESLERIADLMGARNLTAAPLARDGPAETTPEPTER